VNDVTYYLRETFFSRVYNYLHSQWIWRRVNDTMCDEKGASVYK